MKLFYKARFFLAGLLCLGIIGVGCGSAVAPGADTGKKKRQNKGARRADVKITAVQKPGGVNRRDNIQHNGSAQESADCKYETVIAARQGFTIAIGKEEARRRSIKLTAAKKQGDLNEGDNIYSQASGKELPLSEVEKTTSPSALGSSDLSILKDKDNANNSLSDCQPLENGQDKAGLTEKGKVYEIVSYLDESFVELMGEGILLGTNLAMAGIVLTCLNMVSLSPLLHECGVLYTCRGIAWIVSSYLAFSGYKFIENLLESVIGKEKDSSSIPSCMGTSGVEDSKEQIEAREILRILLLQHLGMAILYSDSVWEGINMFILATTVGGLFGMNLLYSGLCMAYGLCGYLKKTSIPMCSRFSIKSLTSRKV